MDNVNADKTELLVTALGNPNVDITIKLKDDLLFRKYDLPYDSPKPVDDLFLRNIEDDFKKLSPEIQYSTGGCAQNTLRIFQWLMQSKFNSIMIGSVGVDDEAKFLENDMRKSSVLTSYAPKNDFKTAFVFIFVFKDYITPVYGTTQASWQYSLADLLGDRTALDSIRRSKIVHLEGFFVIHSDAVGRKAIELCAQHSTMVSFNICGEYVPKSYSNVVIPYIKLSHIVIGNRAEFLAVCAALNVTTDNFEQSLIAVYEIMTEKNFLTNYKIKSMKRHNKILIVTNGIEPVYCINGNNNVIKYEVSKIPEDDVKDATGAGDSFLAGFLYGLSHEFPILKCLELACKTAALIVQQHGCVVPERSSSTLLSS